VLLRHWCGRTDLPIGTDVANRDVANTEELIGFFVNQVVLRVDLSGDPSFRELLGRVREVALGAYSHQALPFSSLVKVLAPRRALGKSPLFQVKLALQNQPLPTMQVEGVRFSPLPVDSGTAKFDLLMNLFETEGRLTGWLEYRADLFEPETASWLVQVFQALLGRVAEEPGERIELLGDLLMEIERQGARRRIEVLEELRRSSLKGARRQAVRA
jgi:non-ribosomal peptide synthetase component F